MLQILAEQTARFPKAQNTGFPEDNTATTGRKNHPQGRGIGKDNKKRLKNPTFQGVFLTRNKCTIKSLCKEANSLSHCGKDQSLGDHLRPVLALWPANPSRGS